MKKLLIVFFFIFLLLQAEEVQLNLPERFDVKPYKSWILLNGVRSRNDSAQHTVFHFKKNEFTIYDKESINYGGGTFLKERASGGGNFSSEKINGKVFNNSTMTNSDIAYTKRIEEYILSGDINASGIFHLILTYNKEVECKVKSKKDEYGYDKYSTAGIWRDCAVGEQMNNNLEIHYLLQLPVNQSQSSQVFIPDVQNIPEEPTESQSSPKPQPTLNLPTTITASASIGAEEEPEAPYDPCKDKEADQAMKDYCAKKAANAKLQVEYDAQDKAEEEAKAKAEADYQKRLKAWNDEEEAQRQRDKTEFAKQREAWRERQREYDKAENDDIAKDQRKRRAKLEDMKKAQEEIKKAYKIIDRFGGDMDSQLMAYKKVGKLSDHANLEKASKIKNALRKQYYDSTQIRLQGEAEYQTSKAKELQKSSNRAAAIRDGALNANKVLAKFDPTGTGNRIVSVMGHIYTAAEGYDKNNSLRGMINHVVTKEASDLSGGYSDMALEEREAYKRYYAGKSIKLTTSEYYYDAKGKRITSVTKGQKVYDKNHHEITYSFVKRLSKGIILKMIDNHNIIKKSLDSAKNLKDSIKKGDIGGIIDASNELLDAKGSLEKGTDKVLKKLKWK